MSTQTDKSAQFSFFKIKTGSTLIEKLDKLSEHTITHIIGSHIAVGILCLFIGLGYNFTRDGNPYLANRITTYKHVDVKKFSQKALSQSMSFDKNYLYRIDESGDKYFTAKGNHEYTDYIANHYQPQLKLLKAGAVNEQEIVEEKLACLNIVEVRNELKINGFQIVPDAQNCTDNMQK